VRQESAQVTKVSVRSLTIPGWPPWGLGEPEQGCPISSPAPTENSGYSFFGSALSHLLATSVRGAQRGRGGSPKGVVRLMRAPHGEQNTNMKGIASKHAAKNHIRDPKHPCGIPPGGGPRKQSASLPVNFWGFSDISTFLRVQCRFSASPTWSLPYIRGGRHGNGV
jgi:hypothetical protein